MEDTCEALVQRSEDKADLHNIVRRTEFYLKTSQYWLQAVDVTPTQNVGWWARRAALSDVFGQATAEHLATVLGIPSRYISKDRLKVYKSDPRWEVWSYTANQVTWKSVKDIAYGEFNGGRRSFWERATNSCSPEIKMRNTDRLVERMSLLGDRVPGETGRVVSGDTGNLAPGDGIMKKEQGSSVDLVEVE